MEKITLCAKLTGPTGSFYACEEIEGLLKREFRPLKTCDDGLISMVTGEHIAGTEEVKIINKQREDSAKVIAEKLADMIVKAMAKDDTHNGWLKNGND